MRKIFALLVSILFLVTSVNATTWYFWRYRTHASDCTSITDGRAGDLCYEEDDRILYICDTADGLCDTASEWKLTKTGRSVTYVVAASDSTASMKNQADYVCDGVADDEEIQAAINNLPNDGGRVLLLEGTYITRAAIKLRSNITLSGSGPSTIIKPVNETKSYLAQDAASGQNQVVVQDASGFEVGMDVIVKDNNSGDGYGVTLATITDIDSNTITLDTNLVNTYTVTANGHVVNVFPVIAADGYHDGTTYTNIVVENLKIDGNKANIGKYTWLQAGIAFIRVTHSVIRNNWVINSNYEGISDQGVWRDTWNKIIGNIIAGAAGRGIHIGTGNYHVIISRNIIKDCEYDGIYLCSAVRYATISDNVIDSCGYSGIGGIGGTSSSNLDLYNTITGNVITNNGWYGIQLNGSDGYYSAYHTISDNVIMNNSQNSAGSYSGIYLSQARNVVIEGNIIYDNQDSKTQRYGIEESGGSDYNSYIGNYLGGNISGDIHQVGSHDVVINGDKFSVYGNIGIQTTDPNYALEVNGIMGSSPESVTIADSGDGNPASYTLTPSTSFVKLTCNDADGCNITLGETDMADGATVTIVNVSTNTCNFSDTAGVSELVGAFAMAQYDSLSLIYASDRWVEVSRSDN